MPGKEILYQVDGHVARITLNAPGKRNALNYTMVDALIAALEAAEDNIDLRVVLLTAAGDNFSAGGDLKEFRSEIDDTALSHWHSGASWERLFELIPRMTKPVVAAVQGSALAGGCGLVALSDIAIAAENAQFGMTEIKVGLFPLLVLPAIRRAIGYKASIDLALTGRIINANEALRLGLVSRVVSLAEFDESVSKLVSELASYSSNAMSLGKRLFRDTADMTYAQAISYARSMRVAYMLSDDLREGINAFLGKRKPEW